ncbi:L,D-transpeptidase family protein [Flavobacterium sp. TSSA_36]|uniref:L,D-transpeptidase family protein n=1 Tax=Flavobacterium sp. TSSA_36 TaxID=3447669 RepID=UPI003F2D897F
MVTTPLVASSMTPLPKLKVTTSAILFDSLLVLGSKNATLIQFYRATQFHTVWQSEKQRKFVLKMIKNAANDGLFTNDYNLDKLETYEKKQENWIGNDVIDYDILLTEKVQLFLKHLKNGKLNPGKMYDNWDLTQSNLEVNLLLLKAFDTNDFAGLLEECRPKSLVYNQLIDALKVIDRLEDRYFLPLNYTRNIELNEVAPAMKTIKKKLRYWGDLTTSDSLATTYDKKTWEAVKRFQARHGLMQDGVIGQGTIEALNFSKNTRKKQIIANLERWRWFESHAGENAVYINIPDYKLVVVENQDTMMTQRIVVGTIKRKTPVLNSYLRTVVLNPTWTIPPTILKEDIVPAMLRNRNYLSQKGIVIYNTKNEVVLPKDWNASKPHNYRYVQGPGPENTLGEMKILFPNRHSIYLHDTNHRNLFGLSNRSLSSGCIRVEKPLELAGYFLNHSEHWDKEKIDSVIASRKTHNIKIEKKYLLYIWYWTAWSDKGKLYFRKDIYEYDEPLYDCLRS